MLSYFSFHHRQFFDYRRREKQAMRPRGTFWSSHDHVVDGREPETRKYNLHGEFRQSLIRLSRPDATFHTLPQLMQVPCLIIWS